MTVVVMTSTFAIVSVTGRNCNPIHGIVAACTYRCCSVSSYELSVTLATCIANIVLTVGVYCYRSQYRE